MGDTYYKRFRMEVELTPAALSPPPLPEGFQWQPWHRSVLERHARTKFACFQDELDAEVFPCLGEAEGCLRLMRDIAHRPQFVPDATWLLSSLTCAGVPAVDCGTIQGVMHTPGVGSIQNVGIIPEYRGRGLGRSLVLQCLHGFYVAGATRVFLEVTARNLPAVQLYRSLGFRLVRTSYRVVEHTATELSVV